MKHFVLDNVIPAGLLRSVAASWPSVDSPHWHAYEGKNSVKLASRSWHCMPEAARAAIYELARMDVEAILGLPGVFPDLEGLNGAGLHHMEAGGATGNAPGRQGPPITALASNGVGSAVPG